MPNAVRSFLLLLLLSMSSSSFAAQELPAESRIPYALTISGGISLGAYESGSNWALVRYLKTSKAEYEQQTNQDQPTFPDLVAVTGASAGSINTLITALTWCSEETVSDGLVNRSDNNLFKSTWVNVGLDALLPAADKHDGYSNYAPSHDDGVLTREAFKKVIGDIRGALQKNIFTPGCHIPFGLTVTAESPLVVEKNGINLINQRVFIPLLLQVDQDGRAHFYTQLTNQFNPNYGQVIYLPSTDHNCHRQGVPCLVDNENVIQAVLASSAFPIAFGRKQLSFCHASNRAQSPMCPSGFNARNGVFLDGGVFDNIPLGATSALAEDSEGVHRRVSYIYIDPGKRRPDVEPEEGSTNSARKALRYDIAEQLGFLGESITTARNYELFKVINSAEWTGGLRSKASYLRQIIGTPQLQQALKHNGNIQKKLKAIHTQLADYEYKLLYQPMSQRDIKKARDRIIDKLRELAVLLMNTAPYANYTKLYKLDQFIDSLEFSRADYLGDRQLLLSSRHAAITGEYLGAFGAFFHPSFREFDYYTGIYDAVIVIAQNICQARWENNIDCAIDKQIIALHKRLQIGSNANAQLVFQTLCATEPGCQVPVQNFSISANMQTASNDLGKVMCATTGLGGNCTLADASTPPEDFGQLLQNLQTLKMVPADAQQHAYLHYAMQNQKSWWKLPFARAAHRLDYLENHPYNGAPPANDTPPSPGKAAPVLSLTNYVAQNILTDKKWLLDNWALEVGSGFNTDTLNGKRMYPAIHYEPKIADIHIPLISAYLIPYQRVEPDSDNALAKFGVIFWPVRGSEFGFSLTDLSFRLRKPAEGAYSTLGFGASMHIRAYLKKQAVHLALGIHEYHGGFVNTEDNVYFNVGLMF